MHYDTEIDAAEDNTSHGLVIRLVGSGFEVLDVGCSTGYLARELQRRGNRVVGVEVDPEAAERAREHCEAVHVADLDRVALDDLPFEHPFDVVVMADVLEHLRDPEAALRAAARLLRPGGRVVLSIPNVAHGSVRLALLDGRFEYRDLGLLDRTHLRFYTHDTLRGLLARAGFVVEELLHTALDPLDGEVAVDRATLDPAVLEQVRADPDAWAYQFVAVARPVTEGDPALAEMLWEQERAVRRLTRAMHDIIRSTDLGGSSPVVAVVSSGAPADRLRATVVAGALRRRLDGFVVETITPRELDRLPAAGPDRRVDAVVVTGSVDDELVAALRRLDAAGGASTRFATLNEVPAVSSLPGVCVGAAADASAPRTAVPDPSLAVAAVHDAQLLGHRVTFLRLTDVLPHDRYVLAALGPDRLADPNVLGRLRDLAAGSGAKVVVIGGGAPTAKWQLVSDDPLDLLAAVHGAALVVSERSAELAAAIALGRPAVAWTADQSAEAAALRSWLPDALPVATDIQELSGAALGAAQAVGGPVAVAGGVAALDDAAELIARWVITTVATQGSHEFAQRVSALRSQLDLLTIANEGLLQRMRSERVAFGRQAADLLAATTQAAAAVDARPPVDEGPNEAVRRLAEDNERLAAEAAAARAELAALMATKTLRTLQPARRLYGRLRSARR